MTKKVIKNLGWRNRNMGLKKVIIKFGSTVFLIYDPQTQGQDSALALINSLIHL